jgi:hypothetical protein
MKLELISSALALVCGALSSSSLSSQEPASGAVLHTRTEFRFKVDAPYEQAAPLFGADEERKWAPGWNPQFVYPAPARDQPGMVFRVEHGTSSSIWTNTAFDLAAGHIQYVYALNDAMVTLIDIHLTRDSPQNTGVSVVYERTALKPDANHHVAHFAKQDEGAGREWESQINGYLEKSRKH